MKTILTVLLLTIGPIAFGQSSKEKNLWNGCWFIPHSGTINMTFYANNTFVFNDYNSRKDKDERLTGKYLLTGNDLFLIYDDRPKQKFKYYIHKIGKHYVIELPKSAGYYFVKGECSSSN